MAIGSCLCGDLRFVALLPSKWVAHCHCTLCQRSSGAAFVTWVGFDRENCSIDDPHGVLTWFKSSAQGERGSCSRCASTLFCRSPRWPSEIHITLANFDGPVDRDPQAHVFWDTRVAWVHLADDGLPRKTEAETS